MTQLLTNPTLTVTVADYRWSCGKLWRVSSSRCQGETGCCPFHGWSRPTSCRKHIDSYFGSDLVWPLLNLVVKHVPVKLNLTRLAHPAPCQSALTCSSGLQLFQRQVPTVHPVAPQSANRIINYIIFHWWCHSLSVNGCFISQVCTYLLLDLLLVNELRVGILQLVVQMTVFIRSRLPDWSLSHTAAQQDRIEAHC